MRVNIYIGIVPRGLTMCTYKWKVFFVYIDGKRSEKQPDLSESKQVSVPCHYHPGDCLHLPLAYKRVGNSGCGVGG